MMSLVPVPAAEIRENEPWNMNYRVSDSRYVEDEMMSRYKLGGFRGS